MTSNSSIYKFTKEHLRHSGWMIILSIIGHLLAGPVLYLFVETAQGEYINELWTEAEIIRYRLDRIQSILSGGNMLAYLFIAMAGAAIVAFGTFYYLFQSSKIDLYHSLPLTRKELFTSGYLSGMLIWFIPFIISNIITVIIACIRMNHFASLCPILITNLKIIGIVALGFFIVYHLCLVAIMLCGNLANAMMCALLYGVGVISVYGLFIAMFAMYFNTFHQFSISPEQVAFLSPLAAPIVMVIEFGKKFTLWKAVLYLGSILLAGINLWLASRLYHVRKSELAGHGLDYKPVGLAIRGLLSLIGGMLGVCFVQAIGYGDLSLVWDLVFGIFVSVFVYGVSCAIQKKSVKAIWKHKMELVVAAAVITGVVLFFHFDIIGYDTYLPRKDNISSMQIRLYGYGSRYYDFDEREYKDFSPYVCEDSEVIYNLLDTAISDTKKTMQDDYYDYSSTVLVHVTPKVGLPYYRSYSISEDSIEAIRPIAEDPAYIQATYDYLYNSDIRFSEASIFGLNRVGTTVEDTSTVAKLRSALIKDMELHSSIEEQTNYLYAADLSFSFKRPDGNLTTRSFSIPVFYENTLNVMSETMEDFVYKAEDLDISTYTLDVWFPDEMSLTDYLTMELLYHNQMYSYNGMANTDGPVAELVAVYEKGNGTDKHYTVTGEDIDVILKYAVPADGYQNRMGHSSYYCLGDFQCNDRYSISAYFDTTKLDEAAIREIANVLEK